jgi:hypothetical protein
MAARHKRWNQASRIKHHNPHNQSKPTRPVPQGQTLLAVDSGDRQGSDPKALPLPEVVSATVFTQWSLEDMTRHLHQWVSVAAAFDHARLKSAGAVADRAGGDALQQVFVTDPGNFLGSQYRCKRQPRVRQESINELPKSAVPEIIGIGYNTAHEKPSLASVGTGSPERASNSYKRRNSSIKISLRSPEFTSFTRAIKDQIASYPRARLYPVPDEQHSAPTGTDHSRYRSTTSNTSGARSSSLLRRLDSAQTNTAGSRDDLLVLMYTGR